MAVVETKPLPLHERDLDQSQPLTSASGKHEQRDAYEQHPSSVALEPDKNLTKTEPSVHNKAMASVLETASDTTDQECLIQRSNFGSPKYALDESVQVSSEPTQDSLLQSTSSKLWSPRWLAPLTLSAFVVLFIGLLLALVLLLHYANQRHGLSTQLTSNHYAWTYGPTALLVLVLNAWRQVDFQCRILAPWKHAIQGAANAQRSLLLDYVSPTQPETLWRSYQHRDWDVFCGTLGVLIIRLAIVVSTGLLVLEPTRVTQARSMFVADSSFSISNTALENHFENIISDDALMTYYGVHRQGLALPYGSDALLAYETIRVHSTTPNATVTVPVNGFFPHFDCDITPVTSNFRWTPDPPEYLDFSYTASPSECPAFSSSLTACNPTELDEDNKPVVCPSEAIVVDALNLPSGASTQVTFKDATLTSKCENLWVWTLVKSRYTRIEEFPWNTTQGWDINFSDMVSLTCYPSYSIAPVMLTIDIENSNDIAGLHLSRPESAPSSHLDNLSFATFSYLVLQDYILPDYDSRSTYNDSLALLLLPNQTLTELDLLVPETLKHAAETSWVGFAAQVVHSVLRSQDHRNVTGTTSYQEQRLLVRAWVVWVMSSCFGALVVCTLILNFSASRYVVPRNPNSIATNAAVVASSDPTLAALLSATRDLSGSEFQKALQHTRIETDALRLRSVSGFSTRVISADVSQLQRPLEATVNRKFWTPLSVTPPFAIWAILTPLCVIVLLEVLQHVSDTRDGILNMSSNSASHSLASVSSTLIMVILGMSYDLIEFAISSFGPFLVLREGQAVGATLLRNDVGQPPILAIIRALRDRRILVAIAALAAILGGLLTIIASGLYTADTVETTAAIEIDLADHFGTYWNSTSSTSDIAGITYGLIEHENASYPSYTFEELAFPSSKLAALPQVSGTFNATMEANLTARRASLDCSVVPKENITVVTNGPTWYTFMAGIPESCPSFRNLSDAVVTAIEFKTDVEWHQPNNTNYQLPFGMLLSNFAFTWFSNGTRIAVPSTDDLGWATNAPGCPSLAFLLGRFDQQQPLSKTNITAMLCVQGLQDIDTVTSFDLPSMTVTEGTSPAIDEASARHVAYEDYIGTFPGSIGTLVDDSRSQTTFREFSISPYAMDTGSWFDGFFQTVMWGVDGEPFDNLVGPANEGRLVSAITHVYRKYMAQAISENMRIPYGEGDAPTYPARLPQSKNVTRLMQNRNSKIVLQSLLGAMVICAIVVYAAAARLKLNRLLPHCPWSMAGVMSLLAGSEMCDRRIMPEGAEYMTDKELGAALAGWLFSLGWWEGKDGQRYGIDVGQAADDGEYGQTREKMRWRRTGTLQRQ